MADWLLSWQKIDDIINGKNSQIKKRIGESDEIWQYRDKGERKKNMYQESQKGGLSTMILFCWI